MIVEQEYKKYTKWLDNPNFLKSNSEFLFFTRKSRTTFEQALKGATDFSATEEERNKNRQKAQKLYKSAVKASIMRFEETIGLSITENTQLIQAFRDRNAVEVVRLMEIAHQRKPLRYDENDTYSQYKKGKTDNNTDKRQISPPATGEKPKMTRVQLHKAIVEEFFKGKEKPRNGVIVFLATGGLPGAGKGTVLQDAIKDMMGIESQEKYPEKYYVIVDPDAIKHYLPEYRNEDGTLNGNCVHRESGEIAEIIRKRALKEGYSVLYDASMRDYPDFRWYNKMVREAREKGYEPKVAFVYDGGEAWYRNSVIRDRALPADGYLEFMRAYDTFDHLAKECGVHAVMYDNSSRIPTKDSPTQIIMYRDKRMYRNKENLPLVKDFVNFDIFRKSLLQLKKEQ
ncbi:MAG: zeta toxin family protein [Thiomargarita sp.]|nr:zeta toxin family protein [Thiomargarita sp.]